YCRGLVGLDAALIARVDRTVCQSGCRDLRLQDGQQYGVGAELVVDRRGVHRPQEVVVHRLQPIGDAVRAVTVGTIRMVLDDYIRQRLTARVDILRIGDAKPDTHRIERGLVVAGARRIDVVDVGPHRGDGIGLAGRMAEHRLHT